MLARLLPPLMLLAAVSAAAADAITPGLYKSTINTEMTMGTMKMPIRTFEREECITAEEIAAGPPMANPEGGECEVVKYDFGGGKINMEMSCRMQGGEGRMVGTGTYTNSSFDMVNDFTMKAEGMEMKMHSTVSAQRVRDC